MAVKKEILAEGVELYLGDCLEVLPELSGIDAVVTDPPYGLSFMGKRWDYDVPSQAIWEACLAAMKPGAHLLAFAGTRTQHRMAVRIEDAGFDIRDMIAWVYGSGFPKSLDVSKAVDGHLTSWRSDSLTLREVNETRPGDATIREQSQNGHAGFVGSGDVGPSVKRDTPATAAGEQWQGWGTALKPALEPITVARKPLIGTVADNVLAHGTGAINVDGCRVDGAPPSVPQPKLGVRERVTYGFGTGGGRNGEMSQASGRWPANLIHDGSEEVTGLFPQVVGVVGARREGGDKSIFSGGGHQQSSKQKIVSGVKDSGSAARFFYCAKASKADRDEGLTNAPEPFVQFQTANGSSGKPSSLSEGRNTEYRNIHPTVKPTALMRYLCRLVTPPGGVVLDPFMGSGSTGKAAMLEGFGFIGIERDETYFDIARRRIEHALKTKPLELF